MRFTNKFIPIPLPAWFLVFILTTPLFGGEQRQEARKMDEEAIGKILAIYVDSWNRHDMDAWGKLFTDDVDYVNRGGGWWKSNKENIEGHKVIHDLLVKQKQKMTYNSHIAEIHFLKPDVALVVATWEWPGFMQPSGEEWKDFKGIITMVLLKRDDRWLIRALQNTVTSPPRTPERASN